MTDTCREAVERLAAICGKIAREPVTDIPAWCRDAISCAFSAEKMFRSLLDERDALTHDITVALDSITQEHEGRIAAEAALDASEGAHEAVRALLGEDASIPHIDDAVSAAITRREAERDAARAAADLLREALTLCINALESGRFESTHTALQTANNTLCALAQEPPA